MHVLFLIRTNECVGLFNSLIIFFSFVMVGWRNKTELGCWERPWRIGIAVSAADKHFGVIIAVVSVPSSLPCSNNLYPDPFPGPSVWSGAHRPGLSSRERRLLDCPAASVIPHASSCYMVTYSPGLRMVQWVLTDSERLGRWQLEEVGFYCAVSTSLLLLYGIPQMDTGLQD